jgi:hypothetical protein
MVPTAPNNGDLIFGRTFQFQRVVKSAAKYAVRTNAKKSGPKPAFAFFEIFLVNGKTVRRHINWNS